MGTSLFDPSSAIDQLLGTLVPGVTPQGPPQMPQGSPQAAQLPPQMNGATAQSLLGNAPGTQGPGVFHRVVSNLLGIPGAVGGAVSDAIRPSMPAGTQALVRAGLISADEAQAARPSLLHSLIGGPDAPSASAQYGNNLNQILGAHQTILGVQQNARIQAARQAVEQLYPTPTLTGDPVKDHQALATNLAQKADYLLGHGDFEAAKDLSSSFRGMMSAARPESGFNLGIGQQHFDNNGKLVATNDQLKQGNSTQYYGPAGDTITVSKDDTPPAGYISMAEHLTDLRNKNALQIAQVRAASAGARAGGGATGFGAGGVGGTARQMAAIVGLNNANDRLTPFENAVSAGTANYSGLDYWKTMQAKMYDAKGIVDPAIHAAVYSKLNQDNPELANYLLSSEQWALEDSQLSGRASDFRTKLDGFVSSIGPNASPKNIANVQSFRTTRLGELNKARVAMEALMARAAGGQSGTPPQMQPTPQASATPSPAAGPTVSPLRGKYNAAVAHLQAQGKSSAEIVKQIGAPPP